MRRSTKPIFSQPLFPNYSFSSTPIIPLQLPGIFLIAATLGTSHNQKSRTQLRSTQSSKAATLQQRINSQFTASLTFKSLPLYLSYHPNPLNLRISLIPTISELISKPPRLNRVHFAKDVSGRNNVFSERVKAGWRTIRKSTGI